MLIYTGEKMSAIRKAKYSLPFLTLGLWSFCLCQAPPSQSPEALLDAVWKGDLQQVIVLLDKGVDVNCRGAYRYTPLIVAAKHGLVEIAEILCDRGADVNVVSSANGNIYGENGYSPLLWAASNCDIEMATILVERGADIELSGEEDDTPLMIASRRNCEYLVRFFVEKGAVVNRVCERGGSTALTEAVKSGNLDIVDYLLSKGARHITDDHLRDKPLLSIAAASNHLSVVRYLVEMGFPVNGRDQGGSTAVHYALRSSLENRYILEYLVEQGGNPSAKNSLGTSPLMLASLHGLPWEVEFLIKKGAAVNDTTIHKETPLHYACRGIPPEPQRSYWNGKESEATIKLLLDKGAKVNSMDHDGKTPLMSAAINEAPRVIELLLSKGALINAQDNRGWTALMYAADWNRTAVIKVLAERGADLNLKNARGNTALDVAKAKNQSAAAYALLKSLGAKEE